MSDHALVPVASLRPLVDSWVEGHEHAQEAFLMLAAASGLSADAWRKRLSDTVGQDWRGWWSLEAIDQADADILLTAMGRPELLASCLPSARHAHVSAKVRIPGETRRIKRLSKASLLTREQIFAVHKLHTDGRLSMREIARRGYRQWGYKSEKSCLNSLCDLLDGYGLERRDRIQATILASTTHGRASRADKAAYKRWHRRAYGFWPSDKRPREAPQPLCGGVRLQYPRKGSPCRRPAMLGSTFCLAHDPSRREEVLERLAAARSTT